MESFMSEYKYSLDAKGRLLLPSAYRKFLGEECIIAKGLDHCLQIYPKDRWDEFMKSLMEMDVLDSNVRKLRRFYMGGASPCPVDKQGRILLKSDQKQYAGIDKDVVLVGAGDYAEIWDENSYADSSYEDPSQVAEALRAERNKR